MTSPLGAGTIAYLHGFLDPTLDEVAQQVAQPQLVIVTRQKEVDQIVHKPTAIPETTECTRQNDLNQRGGALRIRIEEADAG